MSRIRNTHSPAVVEKVLTLKRAGHTKSHIRDEVGISEHHVEQICAAHRATLPAAKPGNRNKAPSGAS